MQPSAQTRQAIISGLTPSQQARLQAHFAALYPCSELGQHEHNIIYLAWLWQNGHVTSDPAIGYRFDEQPAGISLGDFEVTFEAGEGEGGGVNLGLTREFYDLDAIAAILAGAI